MTHEPDTPNSISALKQKLALATLTDDINAPVLERQAALLDGLFTSILEDKIAKWLENCDRYPESVMEWTALALRIQKQCADTIKTGAAIDYMASLGHTPNTGGTLPHPRKIEKQTGLGDNDS